MSTLRTVSEFITQSSPGFVPGSVKEKMRVHVSDTLTAAIAGSVQPVSRLLRNAVGTRCQEVGPCAVWGTGYKADARTAAFLNGAASHVLDIDDTGGCDHSGAVVIPAVVSACQSAGRPISLDQMLESVAVGYEVARRVQYAFGGYTALNSRGWHSTGVCGPFGAAAGASRAMGLSGAETINALGIVSSTASGGWSFRTGGGDNKALHAGNAAAGGMEATSLAAHGVEGSRDVFEDCWGGLVHLFGEAAGDIDLLTSGLGSEWVANESTVKPFPTCASTHPIIEVALCMVADGVVPEDIKSIEISLSPLVAEMCGELDRNLLDSHQGRKFSIPFALSSVLAHGSLSMVDILDGPRRDELTFGLIDRCSIVVDSNLSGARGDGHVRMVCKGGVKSYSSDSLINPQGRVRTIEDVLVKADEVLRSTGTHHNLRLVESLAFARGDLPLTSVLDCRKNSPL